MSTVGLDLDEMLDVEWVRSQFPDSPRLYLAAPGGWSATLTLRDLDHFSFTTAHSARRAQPSGRAS